MAQQRWPGFWGVSRSGYYARDGRKASRHAEEEAELADLIRRIFEEHYGRYGSPRIWAELRGLGRRVSRKRVERLMKEQGLRARRRRKWAKTTNSHHRFACAGNILARNFRAAAPGEKWVSDITYLRTSGSKRLEWQYFAGKN